MDFSGDNNIQYTEFLVAASKKQLLFSNENLLATFKYFDVDNDGRITARDIATSFNLDLNELKNTMLGKSHSEIMQNEAAEQKKFEEQKREQAEIAANQRAKEKLRHSSMTNETFDFEKDDSDN